MAGKKEKKAKKDDTPSLLPKVIGGIKLPKDARRQLTGLAKHPVIADLIAAGLMALAQRIKGDAAKQEVAPDPAPPAAPETPPKSDAAPAKPVVKRIRKPAAKPAEPSTEQASAKPAKAPPPRRTRKSADTPAKPRTRRTPPKTDA